MADKFETFTDEEGEKIKVISEKFEIMQKADLLKQKEKIDNLLSQFSS